MYRVCRKEEKAGMVSQQGNSTRRVQTGMLLLMPFARAATAQCWVVQKIVSSLGLQLLNVNWHNVLAATSHLPNRTPPWGTSDNLPSRTYLPLSQPRPGNHRHLSRLAAVCAQWLLWVATTVNIPVAASTPSALAQHHHPRCITTRVRDADTIWKL
jgi:hypothetical protein